MTSTDPNHEDGAAEPAPTAVPVAEAAAAPLEARADAAAVPAASAEGEAPADAQVDAPVDARAEVTPLKAPRPDLSPEATGARLSELFPALFVGPTGNGTWKPIKLKIHADIQARAPGQFSKRALGIFFSRYTTTTAYLRALAAPGAQRYDLDGQPAGEIAEEHRALAAEEVARRQAIVAERRAAQREAHLQAQRAARQAAAEQARAQAPAPQRAPRAAREDRADRPARPDRPDRPGRPARPERAPQAHSRPTRRADEPQAAPVRDDDPDPARRERALLLRAFESSPLAKSNFCVLKRIDEKTLDAALELARKERAERSAPSVPPPRRA